MILFIFTFGIIIKLHKESLFSIVPGIAIIFLIPGRIQGYYYRNFFRARKLLGERRYEESIMYNEKFLKEIQLYAWRKKLIWLSWGMYSKDIEAMALNNLGTSYLHLGKLDVAEFNFYEAIKLDTLYPIPYYNLSILSHIRGDVEEANNLYKKAFELGFKQTTFDKVVQIGQQILSNIEGK